MSIKRIFVFCVVLLCCCITYAQSSYNTTLIDMNAPKATAPNKTTKNKESKKVENESVDTSGQKTLIYLEHTDLISFDNDVRPDIQVLIGNVIFRHDSVYLYCDSAYLNQKDNSFDAFSNVKIEQGDTIDIFSNKLKYDGNTKIAYLFEDVKLINKDVTLTTDTLTYDRNINLAYYTCGGVIKDSANTLISKHGYYNSNSKLAEFKLEVVAYNKESNLKCDTLTYNTDSNIANILGPTTIVHSDSTIIYTEDGSHNYNTNCSELLKNSVIYHNDDKTLEGDTIFYDKNKGIGRGYNNVILTDTINHISLHGNYGYYIEKGEIGLMTDSAMLIEFSQKDTIYAHGDTLYTYAINDSNNIVLAYHNVRLFQKEYQGVCDSLLFSSKDSVLHLMDLPIVWTANQQINGDTIIVFPKNGTIDRMQVKNNAIMIQQEDSIHYNQISGKEIVAHIKNENLDSVDVLGNAQSIFYPADQGEMIGMNTMESSYMTIFFKDGELERVRIFPSPKANMYPMSQIKENMLYLNNFTWQIEARPKYKEDIFNRPKRITQAEIDKKKQELKDQEQEERKNKRKNRKNKKDKNIDNTEEEE